jgi:rhodanese-related sulfurtransferase
MPSISMASYRDALHAGDMQTVDVRSPSEFASGHIPGATNIPLEQICARQGDIATARPLVLVCQTGRRATMAAETLEATHPHARVLEGSTAAWIAAGYTVVRTVSSSWSLERQVRLAAGVMILVTLGLASLFSAKWLFGTAFIGAGLTFAGATDICGMGLLLAAMPWNQNCSERILCEPSDR